MNAVLKERPVILGAWRLKSIDLKHPGGEVTHPYGNTPEGILMYQDNGYMSVHISDPQRPRFAKGDFLQGSHEELKRAFEGYLGYFGSYEYHPDKGYVIHYPMQSLFPDWTGSKHVRYTEIEDNTLVITTPPILFGGEECVMVLTWEKSSLID